MIKLDSSKFSKGLVKGYKLVPYLEKAIAESSLEWTCPPFTKKKGDDAFHPSSDCLPSIQDLYWDRVTPYSQKLPGSLNKSFQIGTFVHCFLQHIIVEELGFADWDAIEAIREKGWGRKTQGKFKPYHWVRGAGDVAPLKIPGYDPILLDIKTCNTFDFKQKGLPQGFKDKYYCQVQIYMDLFDLDEAIILKFQKDSPHEMEEVPIFRCQEAIDIIYEKWKIVSRAIESNTAPTQELSLNHILQYI